MTTKLCTKCNTIKLTTEFYKQSNQKDGLQRYCKTCKSEMQKEYKEKNKELIKIKSKEYKDKNRNEILIKQKIYRDNNKDKAKEYYESNKEEILKKQKLFYLENIERIKQIRKIYRDSNKELIRLNKKIYRDNNKDKLILKRKIYRELNYEEIKIRKRNYYLNNRDLILSRDKERFNNNRDRYLQKKREYNKTDFAKASTKNAHMRRRSIIKTGDVSTKELNELTKSVNKCYWCNISLKNKIKHIDHYIPLSKGGEHTLSNLVVSCPHCNLSKNAKDPYAFANSLGRLI